MSIDENREAMVKAGWVFAVDHRPGVYLQKPSTAAAESGKWQVTRDQIACVLDTLGGDPAIREAVLKVLP